MAALPLRIAMLTALVPVAAAAQQRTGIVGHLAPDLGVTSWFNLGEGKRQLELAELRGKVVYLYCFQSWCPGCHSRGFPTLKRLTEHYADTDDVAFLAVQTVFEGFETNTLERAKATAEKYALDIPFGHDPGPDGKGSILMRRYRTGGTPWSIVIDKNGVVRFADFFAKEKSARALIEKLRFDPPLVGSAFGKLDPVRWIDDPIDFADSELTLIRWWTNGCPFCMGSLPALSELGEKIDGLRVVGMYHPKPMREVSPRRIRAHATKIGFRGDLAQDPEWRMLRDLQRRGMPTRATSVSVLIDREGVIRWIHQGPRIHRRVGDKFAAAERDLQQLERVVTQLLATRRDAGRVKDTKRR